MYSDNAEYVEPSSRLTVIPTLARMFSRKKNERGKLLETLGNEVCWETVLELLRTLEGIVHTSERHAA